MSLKIGGTTWGTFSHSDGTAYTRAEMVQAYRELIPDRDVKIYKSQAEEDAYYAAFRAVVPDTSADDVAKIKTGYEGV